ncbi:serine/threonine-protein kinase [Streptomyces sp. Go-475]|uniref:serine/threonine-protein kinase n=1 Tax=Streptomyces sp. Go-475 TaxID=2072505 RepID=UPI000DEEC5F9|nr:serine/threonine-protein kinase [Streptomyces sp. Go-475]AXE85888.1 Serine/threonine-protein kinase AfsK [Streptomyces sp. Go-475]
MALRDSDPAEVGGYRIEDRLGSGGMGVVYLARSASGRRLAVKVVHGQYADDDEFRIRFRREVAAARRVSGAFTAPVVDADADAPRPWMATLYIPGADLGIHVREHGPLPLPRLRELAAGLTEALRDIHRAGVVHRDLKPANVMLAEDGPRVIDFGISRAAEFAASDALTQTGRVMGTPPFMSPEQFASPQDVGPAADIFSLGSVLTYAATRRGPFDSPSPYETALRVVEGDPDLSGVPDELLPLVSVCLKKHPKSRATPDELLALLRDGLAQAGPRPGITGPGSVDPRPTQPKDAVPGDTLARLTRPGPEPAPEPAPDQAPSRRRRRYLLAAAALGAVLAVFAATTLALTWDPEPPARETPAADLPDGWRPWSAKAKGAGGAGTTFRNCAAVDASLVCAGDDLMAARFALADGRNTWTLPVDPTPGDNFSDEGAILGTGDGRVYAYGADDRGTLPTGEPVTRYTVQALAADTGKVLWRTVTGEGPSALAPNSDHGAATAVPEGLITVYGAQGESYALIGTDDGEVRWRRPLPGVAHTCVLDSAAAHPYLVCVTDEDRPSEARTSVAQLDPATGRPRWTVRAKGALNLLGEDQGRLVLAGKLGEHRDLTRIDTSTRAVTTVRLSAQQPDAAVAHLAKGTLYFTQSSGSVRAVSPRNGRLLWESNSTVERQGTPTVTDTRLYLSSPNGRLAALDTRTGRVEATRPGRDDGGSIDSAFFPTGAPLVLAGDALYVPYGIRSVYTVDVRDL